MATIAQDTFVEGADTLLENHTPDTGTGWVVDAVSEMKIIAADNELSPAGTSQAETFARETTEMNDDDMDVTLDVNAGATGGNTRGGPIGRLDSADIDNETCYFAHIIGQGGGALFDLRKSVSGTVTLLGRFTSTLSNTVFHTIKIELIDATKKLFVNGTERVSSTDNAVTGNNFAGIHSRKLIGGSPTRMDNFLSEGTPFVAAVRKSDMLLMFD